MTLANRSGIQNSRTLLRAFGGLNETYACSEAEYSAGINFSARNFPALSTRTPRRKLREVENLNGMYHLNGLLTVCGRDLVYTPDEAVAAAVTLENAVADSKKTLVGIGTKILIFPDKAAFDTAERTLQPLGAAWSGEQVEFAPCDAEGRTYEAEEYGRTEPEHPADGALFLKVEDIRRPWSSDSTLEIYSAVSGNWSAIPLDYCRVTAEGIGKGFRAWDTVTVQGTAAKQGGQFEELDGDRIVYEVQEGWLRVKATPGGAHFYGKFAQNGTTAKWTSIDGSEVAVYTVEGPVQVERKIPDLDFVTECDNRVWGCSSKENVIYACKLGDPTNWFSYRGIAADSYAVTVGSDGPFTGAATCMGYALFFKENALHKLYGSKPSDFQLSSLRCRGVARNAGRSLCVLNETLYYLSADGVMAWDGSLPTKVSTALDAARLSNVQRALGGALDGRYYLCLSRGSGEENTARLLVYDTERGCGRRKTSARRRWPVRAGSSTCGRAGPLGRRPQPGAGRTEHGRRGGEHPFALTTGDIGMDAPEEQYLSRLTLRLDAEVPSRLEVSVSYDGGPWEKLAEKTVEAKRQSIDLPFVPRRCGTLRLRLEGAGQITLRGLAKTMAKAQGGIFAAGKEG